MTFYLAWKQDTAALIPSESEIKPVKQVSYVHTYIAASSYILILFQNIPSFFIHCILQ
jgi:hypothetical protein